MRTLRTLGYGFLGMLPGLAVIVIPVGLYELGWISSDASQIGFVGMPIAFIGLLVGLAMGYGDHQGPNTLIHH